MMLQVTLCRNGDMLFTCVAILQSLLSHSLAWGFSHQSSAACAWHRTQEANVPAPSSSQWPAGWCCATLAQTPARQAPRQEWDSSRAAASWETVPSGPCQGHLLANYGQETSWGCFKRCKTSVEPPWSVWARHVDFRAVWDLETEESPRQHLVKRTVCSVLPTPRSWQYFLFLLSH